MACNSLLIGIYAIGIYLNISTWIPLKSMVVDSKYMKLAWSACHAHFIFTS